MSTGRNFTGRMWFENGFKTLPATVNCAKIPMIAPNFRATRSASKSQVLNDSPEPRITHNGKLAGDFDFRVEVLGGSSIDLLKGFFGSQRRQGTAALYTDDFVLGDHAYVGFEEQHADATAFFQTYGGLLTRHGFEAMPEGVPEESFGGLAAYTVPTAATVVNGSTTDRTGGSPLDFLHAYVMIDGAAAAYVKRFSLNVDRGGEREIAMDQTDASADVDSMVATVSGSITARLLSYAFADAVQAGTEISLKLVVPSMFNDGHCRIYTFPTVTFRPAVRTINGPSFIEISAEFDAHARGAASGVAGYARGAYMAAAFTDLSTKTLIIDPDGGGDQTVTFTVGATDLDEVATQINAQTTGLTASVERKPGDTGGVLLLQSDTTGTGSSIEIDAASTADGDLGFDNVIHSGLQGCSVFVQNVSNAVAAIT